MFELAGLGLGIEEILGMSLVAEIAQPELMIPTLLLLGGLAVFKKVKTNHEKKEREKQIQQLEQQRIQEQERVQQEQQRIADENARIQQERQLEEEKKQAEEFKNLPAVEQQEAQQLQQEREQRIERLEEEKKQGYNPNINYFNERFGHGRRLPDPEPDPDGDPNPFNDDGMVNPYQQGDPSEPYDYTPFQRMVQEAAKNVAAEFAARLLQEKEQEADKKDMTKEEIDQLENTNTIIKQQLETQKQLIDILQGLSIGELTEEESLVELSKIEQDLQKNAPVQTTDSYFSQTLVTF